MRYRCNDVASADDLTSAIFERALNRIGDYRPERAPFGAWLFAIARNLVNNQLRLNATRPCLSIDEAGNHPADGLTPEQALIETETQAELVLAMRVLSERERDLLSLKFAVRLNNRQIAEMTGLGESNVGIILYRALHKLRIAMKEGRRE